MAGNVDVLKKGYEDFNRGDIQAATEPWPDDFVWEGPNAQELPGAGVHEGKEAALQALQEAVGNWDEFRLVVDELVGDGDTIVALAHNEVSKGGNSAKLPVVHIWRFRDGNPTRLQILTDTLQAARLLGVV
jgi:ketosteroid isomerase-like protein